MIKIVVTGATGLVGTEIIKILGNSFKFIPFDSKTLDITDKKNLDDTFSKLDFDVILHLAAYTNVDGAEINKDLAYKINVEGTKNIFETAKELGKKFIYFSTDFVFDGTKPPYDELSDPNPLGYYAKTKYEGEKIVAKGAMIVRISYPYSKLLAKQNKPDFANKIASKLQNGDSLCLINNCAITPTYIEDIAFALKHLINNFKNEIFHLVGGKSYTPYEIGLIIKQKIPHSKSFIKQISFEEFSKDRNIRPKYSIILSSKNNFYKMRSFEEAFL